jgi:hypothetical protein
MALENAVLLARRVKPNKLLYCCARAAFIAQLLGEASTQADWLGKRIIRRCELIHKRYLVGSRRVHSLVE